MSLYGPIHTWFPDGRSLSGAANQRWLLTGDFVPGLPFDTMGAAADGSPIEYSGIVTKATATSQCDYDFTGPHATVMS